jgi:hypothetical protein
MSNLNLQRGSYGHDYQDSYPEYGLFRKAGKYPSD